MCNSYLPDDSPVKNEVALAKVIIFRHATGLLRHFTLDELVHEARLGFWLAQQASIRRGRPDPGVGFLYRGAMWRLKGLWRWRPQIIEVPLVPQIEGEDEGEADHQPEASIEMPEPADLESVVSLMERLLDFHSRGQGRLNIRRWLLGLAIGESHEEIAAALGIKRGTLRAQIRAVRLYLMPYRADIKAVMRGEMSPDDVPLRPAPSRWRLYGEKRGQVACDICGKPARTLHHIQPRRWGGADEKINLVPLCEHCHGRVEVHYMRIERPGMAITEWHQAYKQLKENSHV